LLSDISVISFDCLNRPQKFPAASFDQQNHFFFSFLKN